MRAGRNCGAATSGGTSLPSTETRVPSFGGSVPIHEEDACVLRVLQHLRRGGPGLIVSPSDCRQPFGSGPRYVMLKFDTDASRGAPLDWFREAAKVPPAGAAYTYEPPIT